MQPVYITGHSRPVRQVLHNHDGDLLFSCSDDHTVCMFTTPQCERIGVFDTKEACVSIDITKDSKHLIACPTTIGFQIYCVNDGKLLKTVNVPGLQAEKVYLSYSDKEIAVQYYANKQSFIRIYSFSRVMDPAWSDKEITETCQISCNPDFRFMNFVWGPLDKSIYACTSNGRVIQYDTGTGKIMQEA